MLFFRLFILLFVALATPTSYATSEVMSPYLRDTPLTHGLPLQALFPKATRFGDKQSDLPVYPIYQLDQLIGYAWLSDEINDLPGFAGKPIKLLIGLTSEGVFQNVAVLDHHEPVFLHGLGNEAMYRFLDQYKGRSVGDQIIIGSAQNSQLAHNQSSTAVFDGVTKATISVMIINDVVLSTALQVARSKLEGFSLPASTALKNLPFQTMDWNTLLTKGLIHHWQVSQQEVFDTLGRQRDEYPDSFPADEDDEQPFIDLYYAYISDPTIGINLLGEEAYQTLIDKLPQGDHVIWIGSAGLYPHAPDEFIPNTVPARISLEQAGLAIEIRDINSALTELIDKIQDKPALQQNHLLRIKGASGFDVGTPLLFNLHITLPRNHLLTDSLIIRDTYQFPASQWITVSADMQAKKTQPLWKSLWSSRWVETLILVISLCVLSAIFIWQDQLSRHPKFHYLRWSYLFFTLFFIGFYAQGQLSVVNIYTLLHAIYDGFDISLFLLDPIIFILWSFTFITLFIWGRGVFCGWLCPFGALQEMSSWLGKKLRVKQLRIKDPWHRKLIYLKYPILLGLVGLSFYSLTLAEQLAEIEPFKTSITLVFDRSWPFVLYAVLLLIVGMFIHKFYCRYLCPLGAGLAIIGLLRRLELLKRIEFCGSPCQTCHHRCEIKAIKRDGAIDYNECIQCFECIVILNDEEQCADKLIKRKEQARILARELT